MSKRAREINLLSLQGDIEIFASTDDAAYVRANRIIGLGEPVPSDTVSTLIFNDQTVWDELKRDDAFWTAVVNRLGLVTFDEVDQKGKKKFDLDEMYKALGAGWAKQVREAKGLTRKSELLSQTKESLKKEIAPRVIALLSRRVEEQENEILRESRSSFLNYMRWYDSEASMNFLILYAYYLASQWPPQLVPLETTQSHKAAPPFFFVPISTSREEEEERRSQFSVPENRPPPTSATCIPEAITTNTRPLIPAKIVEYSIMTTLTVATVSEELLYSFYIETKNPLVFVIKQGLTIKTIPVASPLSKILKFFYGGTIILILSGPDVKKLIRFGYASDLTLPIETVVDYFALDYEWDDLTYVRSDKPVRYASPRTVFRKFRDVQLLDLSILAQTQPQVIRTFSSLTPQEKIRMTRQGQIYNQGKGRFLTNEEREIIAQIRGSAPIDLIFSGLTTNEVAKMQKATGYITLQKDYIRDTRLFIGLRSPDLSPVYKESEFGYVPASADRELVAIRLLNVPSEISTDVLHVAVLSRFHLKGGGYIMLLDFIKYERGKLNGVYNYETHSVRYLENLPGTPGGESQFMYRDTCDRLYVVSEFNIIFHPPRTSKCKDLVQFAYVQVAQTEITQGIEEERTFIVNSRDVLFNYSNQESRYKPEDVVADFAFFDLVKKNGYRIYDYRLEKRADKLMRFHCIFYKYYYETQQTKLLFYKQGPITGNPPTVADIVIGKLPYDIPLISPIHEVDLLCYITFRGVNDCAPLRLYKIGLKPGEELFPYANNYSLASTLKTQLTISPTHCTFCGNPGSKDNVYCGEMCHVYCDTLCQHLFHNTLAM